MLEVEVKFLEVDVPTLMKKLTQLGAKKTFEGEITATYFDFPNGSLREKGTLIRLRKKGNMVELTCKQRTNTASTAKENMEFEIHCTDFDTTKQILEKIGLMDMGKTSDANKIENTGKHRTSYAIGNVHFEFDTFPGVPTFLEIEAQDVETITEWAQKLGLDMQDAKPWTGKDLLRHYGKRTLT